MQILRNYELTKLHKIFLNHLIAIFLTPLDCMIKLRIGGQKNDKYLYPSWKIGDCYGPKQVFDNQTEITSDQYEANNTFIDMCCLGPGTYTLRCINSMGPYGWGESYIEAQGQRYCDDFVGLKGLRKISIEGMKKLE